MELSHNKMVHVERLALDCCDEALLLTFGKLEPKISFINSAFARLFGTDKASLENIPLGYGPFSKDLV
jgi:hypothetical protein